MSFVTYVGSNSINDPSTDLASLITQVGTTWAVKAHPNEPYFRVFIDINNIITSCDCLSFVSTQTPCIHMCMLKWYNKGIILAHSNQQTNVAPHSQPPRQQSMQQPLPQQPLPQQPLPQQPLPQQPLPQQPLPQQPLPQQPLPQQPLPKQPLPKQPLPKQPLPKQPLPKQPLPQQSLPLPSKRGRPKNDFIASTKRAFKYYKPQSKLPTTPAPQQASPVQQPSSMQSPVSSAIQQQL
ncbi:hypothetical protein FB192DRAFT_1063548 [Mucor lusitanicus]|uniref:SWIM-type domain-containing protein n=1 Tax=Mucor circinelloides f. lusitanicus TaxID=29924 RepID=A0A8H4BNR5_MUCCL|nr:hypothetical protein FB192DRAFT_1063548 [Mucor lusitanicus]